MRKLFLLLVAAVCSISATYANPGDTTWVQANNVQMAATTNYDTAITFPASGVTYRKILMVFTLSKYVCPGSPQYCGSWDYLVNNYVMTPGGDTMEISRLITPYATTSTYFPNTWSYDYVFDVTDYASLLQNAATIRIAYGGYSYGFAANVRFAFIEGTPDRTVKGLQRLWHGSFQYGVAADPITNHVFPLTETVPAGTVATAMKMRITGHGEDGNDCNEFCPNTYDVILNNADIQTQNFFRTTCGQNPIYSQTGTWMYDRANWCPGALVNDIYDSLPVASGTYSVNVTFPSYTTVASSSGNSDPTYDIEAASVYYGGYNKTLDASLEEILAPNKAPQYSRINATCGQPVIHVHNAGSTPITSLSINYGVVGSATSNYVWNGTLAPLHDSDISIPAIAGLLSEAGLSTTLQFTATIVQVNGQTDGDATNNTMTTSFVPTPLYQSNHFVVKFKTSTMEQYAESYQIMDADGNVVAQRNNATQNTLYTDTVSLPSGCYEVQVSTPDGFGLILGEYTGNSADNGSFTMTKVGSSIVLSMPNYHGGDFGDMLTQYFATSAFPASVATVTPGNESIDAYPNPAQGSVTVNINGVTNVAGTIQVVDAIGRTVANIPCNNVIQTINLSNMANGVYTITYYEASGANKLQTRLVIAE